MAARNYARLHRDWYDDPILCQAADEEPVALHIWPVLIAKAKSASHHVDNPTGKISTSLRQLAAILRVDPAKIMAALDVLVEAEMITVETGRAKVIDITLCTFCKWQVASGSSAERTEDYRERQKALSRENVPVSDGVQQNATQYHETETEMDTERKGIAREPAHESAPTHEAKTIRSIPDPDLRALSLIQRYRRDLGPLALVVDELATLAAQKKNITELAPITALADIYRPIAMLLPEWGRDVLGDALAVAIRKEAPSGKFVRSCCQTSHDDRERRKAEAAVPIKSRYEYVDGLGDLS